MMDPDSEESSISESTPLAGGTRNSSLSKRDLVIIVIMAMLTFSSFSVASLIAPFFPREAMSKGVSLPMIGVIISSFQMGTIAAPFVTGFIVIPRLGAKLTIILGTILSGITTLSFGMLKYIGNTTMFSTLCIMCRLLEACGEAFTASGVYCVIAQCFPHRLLSVQAVTHVSYVFAIMSGPSIGALLYKAGGYSLPFIVLGSAALVTAVGAWLVLPSCNAMGQTETGVAALVKITGVQISLLISVQNGLMYTVLYPILSLFLTQLGMGITTGSAIFMISPGVNALFAPISAYLFNRGFQYSLACFGLIMNTVAFFIIGPEPLLGLDRGISFVIIALALSGAGACMANQSVVPLIIYEARRSGQIDYSLSQLSGAAASLHYTADAIGCVIGPVISSTLYKAYGFQWTTTICASIFSALAFFTIASSAVHCKMKRNDDERSSNSF